MGWVTDSELGWVDPRVGFGWVGSGWVSQLMGWVGLVYTKWTMDNSGRTDWLVVGLCVVFLLADCSSVLGFVCIVCMCFLLLRA